MTGPAPWAGTIGALYRYPVKSMQGESVSRLDVGTGGVSGDRSLALLDLDSGRVVSAHHPQKWGSLLECRARWDGEPDAGGCVVVILPDGSEEPAGPGLEAKLSDLLGRRVGLIREAPEGGSYEIVHPDLEGVAPDAFIERTLAAAGVRDGRVGRLRVALDAPRGALVDVSPIHFIAGPSITALRASGEDADIRRFRPNLILDGPGDGYVEEAWNGALVSAAGVEMQVSMPTPRCVMTTLAQRGLGPDQRPLRRLATDNRIQMGSGGWACLGSYANVQRPGVVRVGDPVLVTPAARSEAR